MPVSSASATWHPVVGFVPVVMALMVSTGVGEKSTQAIPCQPKLWPAQTQRPMGAATTGHQRHNAIVTWAVVKPAAQIASTNGEVRRLRPAISGRLIGDDEVV